MKLTKVALLSILAIVGVAVVAEIATSWYSKRSGPFAVLASGGDVRSRQGEAVLAIERFFETPRTIDQTTAFLSQAGFTCETGRSEKLLQQISAQVQADLRIGVFCNYKYGRYFMYYYKFIVTAAFDSDGKSAYHEVYFDF